MDYYKIILGGRGSEVYPFELNEEQYESLLDGNVETDGLDYDDICQILNIESYFDCINETIMGPYTEELYMRVEDLNGVILYETEGVDYDKCSYRELYNENKKYLFIEDYCKGQHIVYDIPLEEEFDISKLKFKIADISERIEIVEGISYEGQDFEIYKGYGTTDSKGLYYILKKEYKND